MPDDDLPWKSYRSKVGSQSSAFDDFLLDFTLDLALDLAPDCSSRQNTTLNERFYSPHISISLQSLILSAEYEEDKRTHRPVLSIAALSYRKR